MAKDVIMPALGMAQETGVLIRWLVPPGSKVDEGDPLMEVETDKAVIEVPAPASGILADVVAREGDEVPIGTVLARLLGDDDDAAAPAQPRQERWSSAVPGSAAPAAVAHASVGRTGPRPGASVPASTAEPAALGATNGRTPASPKAKRIARELGVTLADVPGSGPEGAVRSVDLAKWATRGAPMPVASVREGEDERSVDRPSRAATTTHASAAHLVEYRAEFDGRALEAFVARGNRYLAANASVTNVSPMTIGDVLVRAAMGVTRKLGASAEGSRPVEVVLETTSRATALLMCRDRPPSVLDLHRARTAGIPEHGSLGAGMLAPMRIAVRDASGGAVERRLAPLPEGCVLRVSIYRSRRRRHEQDNETGFDGWVSIECPAATWDEDDVTHAVEQLVAMLEDPFVIALTG